MLRLSPFGGLLALAVACTPSSDSGGLPPAAALATFDLMPGFTLVQVAAEPLIADPVALEIDENGLAWVVEMPGYPLDLARTGRVKTLRDTDGDGSWDQATLFAEGLILPTGIMRWRAGVLVTDAPHVLYLADTDGDGRADQRDTLLTGFALSNPQHNFNTPWYGLDNSIHLANEYTITSRSFPDLFGDEGGPVHFPSRPDGPRLPPNAADRSVRFRPDTYELSLRAGSSQYGHTFDAWGHYFTTSNATHLWHEVLAAPYLARKPELWASDPTHYVPAYGRPVEVFPATDNPDHQLLTDVGTITSACGIAAYLGGAFPAIFDSVIFTCEPTHNLVHADRLRSSGATYASERLVSQGEFLRSTDPWFRPVYTYVGPEGALYVVDYYRRIIEHPEWMADDVNASGLLYEGTRQGRIYRITYDSAPSPATPPDLGQRDAAGLVAALAHPNGWWRRHAQRLLVDQQDPAALPLLREMAADHPQALARLHALWTLAGLGATEPALLIQALNAAEPGLREQAIVLAEPHLDRQPSLLPALHARASDPDPRVRFQLLCTLGARTDAGSQAAWEQLVRQDWADSWAQLAALTAPAGEARLRQWLAGAAAADPEAAAHLAGRLGALDGLQGDWPGLAAWLDLARAGQPLGAAALTGFAQGLAGYDGPREGLDPIRAQLLALAVREDRPLARGAATGLLAALGLPAPALTGPVAETLRQRLAHSTPDQTADALALLGLLQAPADTTLFLARLAPQEPLPVQEAAIRALGAAPDLTPCAPLLGRWSTLTPGLRDIALEVLTRSPGRIALLLDAIETGAVDVAALGWRRQVSLMNHDDASVRQRARDLLAGESRTEAEVVAAFLPALDLAGQAEAGRQVFAAQCAACHQVQGRWGQAYGPDLATLRHRQPRSLMTDILLPQRSIADGYELWLARTHQGETHAGILVADDGDRLRLRTASGAEVDLRRQQLGSLEAAAYSAMPMGMGDQLSQQDMADLLAFLRQWPELGDD